MGVSSTGTFLFTLVIFLGTGLTFGALGATLGVSISVSLGVGATSLGVSSTLGVSTSLVIGTSTASTLGGVVSTTFFATGFFPVMIKSISVSASSIVTELFAALTANSISIAFERMTFVSSPSS